LLPWQQGLAREKFIGTIKSAVSEKILFGENSAAPAFVQAKLWPIWVEIALFSLPWQQGSVQGKYE